ncbi:hypothetical protein ACFQ4C_21500 [Larkinella insperata]|uniref:Viral A-type inclusion protein n=1 Tax=Larkinella insperata TaxID=332158 RepID=A0ABW3QBM6_9BACT
MRNTITSLFFGLLGLFLAACPSSEQHRGHQHAKPSEATGPVAELESQVLAVHDSIMARMGDLMDLQKEVAAKAQQSEGEAKETGNTVGLHLQKADEAMTDWMHQYKGDTLNVLDQEQALAYLRQQQLKVNDLSRLMQKTLREAENYVEK